MPRHLFNKRDLISTLVAVLVTSAAVTGVFYLEIGNTAHKQSLPNTRTAPGLSENHITPAELGTLTLPSFDTSFKLVPISIVNSVLPIMGSNRAIGVWNSGGSLNGTTGTVLCVAPYSLISPLSALRIGNSVVTGTSYWTVSSVSHNRSLPNQYLTANGPRRLVIVVVGILLTIVVASPV